MTTILVADDNHDSRLIYGTYLEVAGYRVIKAADGIAALAMTRAERPDLVLLNLVMPGLNGHEVLECMRAEPGTAAIPCLFVTGDEHFVIFRNANGDIDDERTYLAGTVLLWNRGPLLLRLEGDLKRDEALELAREVE